MSQHPSLSSLIVVDVQNDFCEGGALAVTGGRAVAQRIHKYLKMFWRNYDNVILTKDWHRPFPDTNGGHFAPAGVSPNYNSTWPAHCVAGSVGADFALSFDGLPFSAFTIVHKGDGKPAYSAFDGRPIFEAQSLSQILSHSEQIDVVGLAYDYCVKATAMDAVEKYPNAKVRVLKYYTASVSPESAHEATLQMQGYGINIRGEGASNDLHYSTH